MNLKKYQTHCTACSEFSYILLHETTETEPSFCPLCGSPDLEIIEVEES